GRVLLIGAGRAGVNIANQLRANGNMHLVGFLDDDPKKVGLVVAGLKVLGSVSMLSAAAARQKIDQVIVCIALPPRQLLRRVWGMCELLGTTVKIVPTVGEILEQKNHIVNLKNVEINDLLGRSSIEQFEDEPEINAPYAGTRTLVEQSFAMGVSRFVQVSTDKAVNPTSIMGASKRICEMIVQQHGSHQKALFCCVRFGNVLGSRGSVVPIFQEQIQRGGPVT